MKLAVLRLSHRVVRDKRISTHLALTARAFGASEFFYTGDHDTHVEDSIQKIQQEWGGSLSATHIGKPWNFLKDWKKQGGIVIHLTMYGVELSDKLQEIQDLEKEELLIVVGGVKVPGQVFELADYNIAIGNQPHSEVAALAVFLDRITEGEARKQKFKDANYEIVPMERGKQANKI